MIVLHDRLVRSCAECDYLGVFHIIMVVSLGTKSFVNLSGNLDVNVVHSVGCIPVMTSWIVIQTELPCK